MIKILLYCSIVAIGILIFKYFIKGKFYDSNPEKIIVNGVEYNEYDDC
tara:strand:+ start:135 stop:278 length:144 start_codon:yes stop_codon:yes gene_type:complete